MEPLKPKYFDQISSRRVFHHAGIGFIGPGRLHLPALGPQDFAVELA